MTWLKFIVFQSSTLDYTGLELFTKNKENRKSFSIFHGNFPIYPAHELWGQRKRDREKVAGPKENFSEYSYLGNGNTKTAAPRAVPYYIIQEERSPQLFSFFSLRNTYISRITFTLLWETLGRLFYMGMTLYIIWICIYIYLDAKKLYGISMYNAS